MARPTRRDRPQMPDGYGTPDGDDGLLDWSVVEARLVEARHYWLSTVRPDGRPHAVPRWGVWLDGALHYDGSPRTVHARNAVTNAGCVLHVGDGAEAITIDGRTGASEPVDAVRGAAIAEEIGRKYGPLGYSPQSDAWSGPDAGGLMVFRPTKALAWFDFPNDLTRFHFDR